MLIDYKGFRPAPYIFFIVFICSYKMRAEYFSIFPKGNLIFFINDIIGNSETTCFVLIYRIIITAYLGDS